MVNGLVGARDTRFGLLDACFGIVIAMLVRHWFTPRLVVGLDAPLRWV
jgi:hypothetical protein